MAAGEVNYQGVAGHAEHVAILAKRVAKRINLDEKMAFATGLLHSSQPKTGKSSTLLPRGQKLSSYNICAASFLFVTKTRKLLPRELYSAFTIEIFEIT